MAGLEESPAKVSEQAVPSVKNDSLGTTSSKSSRSRRNRRPKSDAPPVTVEAEGSTGKKSGKLCRFYAGSGGCRAGSACRFRHIAGPEAVSVAESTVLPLRPARPRSFQVNQLRRRFSPKEHIRPDGSMILEFVLQPTDPDFPFHLPDGLRCKLLVPNDDQKSPSLQICNEEMTVEWQASISAGFSRILACSDTMLRAINRLDQQLETLLTKKPEPLITIIPNQGLAPERRLAVPADPMRPLEWDQDSSSEDETSSNTSQEAVAETSARTPERGVALSFPNLELYTIELLQLDMLSLTIKCLRCKDIQDVDKLRSESSRKLSCKKCATSWEVTYRSEMIHTQSNRAGFLDLEGCTVVDMLPSLFVPTCGACSTVYPGAGVSAVRGASSMAICRHCHNKMTFKIVEVKFLLTRIAERVRTGLAPKKKKPENLGIIAGQPLPREGRCRHYGKSYRWFRFSCCEKVFPCDRCHDEASEHVCERAHRMLCGFCSREQNFRPEDCAICHMSVIKRSSKGGFWEGGQGTRDKARMSRKDPRKYKRR